ncbi:MAG TPA: FkbM family methyltransferase [Bryobacteraceae bacterium]|nr:FkbM family methyltransferase [Bryobacteraceae bacterium]
MELVEIGPVDTTEACNLYCVMCHFNGPTAARLEGTPMVEEVRQFACSVPPGPLWFASTGDFLTDSNAMQHLRTAVAYGHVPHVPTDGQLLTPALMDEMLGIGVEEIPISADAIEADSYRKIRRGRVERNPATAIGSTTAGISKVKYLKIDAQGGDLAVIRSAGERLRDIDRISLEVQITAVPLYRNAPGKEEVVRFLDEAGFDLVTIEQQSHGQEENLTFSRRAAEGQQPSAQQDHYPVQALG